MSDSMFSDIVRFSYCPLDSAIATNNTFDIVWVKLPFHVFGGYHFKSVLSAQR